jgi:hypothetical protein
VLLLLLADSSTAASQDGPTHGFPLDFSGKPTNLALTLSSSLPFQAIEVSRVIIHNVFNVLVESKRRGGETFPVRLRRAAGQNGVH